MPSGTLFAAHNRSMPMMMRATISLSDGTTPASRRDACRVASIRIPASRNSSATSSSCCPVLITIGKKSSDCCSALMTGIILIASGRVPIATRIDIRSPCSLACSSASCTSRFVGFAACFESWPRFCSVMIPPRAHHCNVRPRSHAQLARRCQLFRLGSPRRQPRPTRRDRRLPRSPSRDRRQGRRAPDEIARCRSLRPSGRS